MRDLKIYNNAMMTDSFYTSAQAFLTALANDMKKHDIILDGHWDIDHLCYRVDTEENYQKLKKDFLPYGKLLIESVVNGRLISTFKLFRPVFFDRFMIDLIELPAPKTGKVTKAGFEHIEVVCDLTFPELLKRYSHLPLDQKGLSKVFNQELELGLGDRNIKFHHCSLESVVNLENNARVWEAIKNLSILETLQNDHALLIGDLLLGNTEAPVQIYVTSSESVLRNQFGQLPEFDINHHVCRFVYHAVSFEIFFADVLPLKRAEFKEFQMNERHLKYQKS